MPIKFQKPRGTADLLPKQSAAFRKIEEIFSTEALLAGFGQIRVPTFEKTTLFARSSGETSDVVSKEMYTFTDRGGEELTLAPEGTAGVVRAFLENGLAGEALPQKLFYFTTCFRYNRPQAGRLREFHQVGFEIFGADSYLAEAELIVLVNKALKKIGIADAVTTKLNSIGCKQCRGEYKKALVAYFEQYKDTLCETCNDRLYKNPMRILDCKSPECKTVAKGAPVITDYLCDDCKTHFDALCSLLTDLGVKYELDTGIVRGLDYYNGPVFEFVTDQLGAQDAVGGGGRYDGLVEELGGQPTPALGLAMGIERMVLLAEKCGCDFPKPAAGRLFMIPIGDETRPRAARLADAVKSAGIPCQTELSTRSLKSSMRYANKMGFDFTLILGEDELKTGKYVLKDMKNDRELTVENEDGLIAALK
ncbi:MAG TPA: histidine--tRNA ligase [Oscillospiraceae bacterium]|nr:histidine--tRNA ligase [Oscillospiraceae bacterium]HPK35382.1 histidine--tRNA ligase [Oscillospiraceae bacterium]HPR75325.1 histidine--tRNA ligase [Oscillospiraceae bacterium]